MKGLADLVDESDDRLRLKLMNICYTDETGFPKIHLFGRDAERNLHHVKVTGHEPSMYVAEDQYNDRVGRRDDVQRVERGYTSLDGRDLVRIYTRLPKHVPEIRDLFDKSDTYEADVLYELRWLIDEGIYTGFSVPENYSGGIDVEHVRPCDPPSVDPRLIVTDIEVASEEGFPEPKEAAWPVSTIVAYDSYDEEYVGWFLHDREHHDTFEVHPDSGQHELDDLRIFSDESELLNDYNWWIEEKGPDLLSGWNSSANDIGDGFDYPYLINRCQELTTWSYYDWSPIGEVYTGRFGPYVKGVTVMDMLSAYEKTQIHKLDSKALDDVAVKELDHSKVELELSHTEMWKERPVEFLKYNKRDVELVVDIETEKTIIEIFEHLREVTGARFEDCHANIDLIDVLVLREAKDSGIRLPTAVKPERGWYHGAHVFEPTIGLHEHVVYPDYSSLYPNMMYQCNMSPETLIGDAEDLKDSEYTEDDCVWSYYDPRPVNVKKGDSPEFEKLYYLKPSVKEGFLRSVVGKVLTLTDRYTGTAYEAVKRVRNCFSGDTEVLTPSGIVNIQDLQIGDDVYSFDVDSGDVEIKPVTRTFEYSGKHETVDIDNSYVDFSVTPNHRMVVKRSRHSDEWEFIEAGEMNEWTHYELPHGWDSADGEALPEVDLDEFVECESTSDRVREHRSGCKWIPRYYDSDDFLKLLAWFITEGSVYTSTRKEYDNGNIRGVSTTINIAQERDGRESIARLLDSMGLDYYDSGRGYTITGSGVLADVLVSLCGSGSENKEIPDMVFRASEEQRKVFWQTMLRGDGDVESNRYTTKSLKLRDDVMRLGVSLGYSVHYSRDSGVWRVRYGDEKNTVRMHRDAESGETDGVYCVEVAENHTLMAGRNGKFQFVGQSVYGVTGDKDSYGRGFRLFDDRLAESITLGGRKVLVDGAEKFVNTIDGEWMDVDEARIVGGDTDSFMTSLIGVVDADQAIMVAERAAETVNEWLPSYCVDTFGVDEEDARMDLELESYATRCFFPTSKKDSSKASKKRYATWITWEDGEYLDEPRINIKGFEYVRSDTAIVTNDVQEYVLKSILTEPIDDAHAELYEYLEELVVEIMGGDYPTEKIMQVSGQIGQPLEEYGSTDRTPQPVYRGAKYANEFIYEEPRIGEGDKVLWCYVDRIKNGGRKTYKAQTKEDGRYVDAVSVLHVDDLPECVVVDRKKMIDKTIISPLNPIFTALEWDPEGYLPAAYYRDDKQMGLEEMM